jgi:hypothetical protein
MLMQNFETFSDVLLEHVKPCIKKELKNLTPREEFIKIIFREYLEIFSSYECLKDIEIIIGLNPYNGKVSKIRLLKYHFTNYFNEVYIMKERLKKFVILIDRKYKKDKAYQVIKVQLNKLEKYIEDSFRNIVKIRGGHVHVERYMNKEFNELDMLQIVLPYEKNIEDKELMERILSQHYKDTRGKLKKQILDNNKQLESIIDYYSEMIMILIVDNKRIVYPSNLN